MVANRKTNYNDLRTVSLNKTNCRYLINRTHLIVLSVVLRQQRGYLFLQTFSYFHSWDLQLSSVCVIHSNGIIGKMQLIPNVAEKNILILVEEKKYSDFGGGKKIF